MAWWQQYTGQLRGFRPFYRWYNWQHRRSLQYNETLYKHFGLQQSVLSPISSKRLSTLFSDDIPWMDRQNERLADIVSKTSFPDPIKEQLLHWPEKGYIVCPNFFSEDTIDRVNTEIDAILLEKKVAYNYTGKKIMQAWKWSPAMKEVFTDQRLLDLLGFVLGKPVWPFHTINFHYGSEQTAHSDYIHMATFPNGYLIAAWVALEDMHDDNGPLFYYPGSHTLDYPTNATIGSKNNAFWLDQQANDRSEQILSKQLKEKEFKRESFFAKKGDVLIWHANLVHGGSPQLNRDCTRRSAAMHYFAEGVIPYHEISERPAIFEEDILNRYQRSSVSSSDGGA